MRKRAANRRKTAIYWPYEPSWDYDPDLEMWSAETDDGFLLMINKYWDDYEQDGYEMQIDYPSGSTGIYWGDNEMKLMEQADYMLNQYRGVNAATSRKANMAKKARRNRKVATDVHSLTRDQLIELKQKMLIDRVDYASWNELLAADYLISDEEVYSEFDGVLFTDDDFFCTVKKARRVNMRKKAYNYWEPMEYSGDDIVEFTDIIPINVYEGKSKYTDGGYVFNAELYIYDDVTWDEYDENESYNWAFYIIEDGSYEWGNYTGVFTGTEWEAQDWADGIIQKFIDDYEAGLITPEGMDYYSQYFD